MSELQAASLDLSAALAGLLVAHGYRRYLLEVEDGKLVSLANVDDSAAARASKDSGYVSMAEAARLLDHSERWLSRRSNGTKMWKHLGLEPRQAGRNLLFKKADVIEYLESNAVRRRGRPKNLTAEIKANV